METSEILANAAAQKAIGDLLTAAAADVGLNAAIAYRLRTSVVDRIEAGLPVPAAINLVETIRTIVRDAPLERAMDEIRKIRDLLRDDELSKPDVR